MEIQNSRQTSALMLILSALSLNASLRGVFDRSLYYDVSETGTLPRSLIRGSQAQDIVSVAFAVLLAVMTLHFLKKQSMKSYIMLLGLAWYFFHALGQMRQKERPLVSLRANETKRTSPCLTIGS